MNELTTWLLAAVGALAAFIAMIFKSLQDQARKDREAAQAREDVRIREQLELTKSVTEALLSSKNAIENNTKVVENNTKSVDNIFREITKATKK